MNDSNYMAYWYNLAWQVKQRVIKEDGLTIEHGVIERMESLTFDYELEKAQVKKKATATVQRDVFGKVVTKGKKGKEKVQTIKEQYVEPKLKTQSINFKTVYQVATGTIDIIGKIEEIKGMIGSCGPLIIGCDYYAEDPQTGQIYLASQPRILGVHQMQLTKMKVSETELDEIGRMTKATVQFTLKECTDAKVTKALAAFPGEKQKEMIAGWVANGYVYNEVENPTKKQNPKKLGWYEMDGSGEYVKTKDKKPQAGKTYYTKNVNPDTVPDEFWSSLKSSPDPNVKALVKQKQADDKAAKKAAAAALKAEVKDLQARIRAGEDL